MWPLVVLENCAANKGHGLEANPKPEPKQEPKSASKRRRRNRRLLFKRGKYFYAKKAMPSIDFCGWSTEEPLEACHGEKDFLGFQDSDIISSHIMSAQHPVKDGEDLILFGATKVTSICPDNSSSFTFTVISLLRRKLRVLSLFDGMSTALHILADCLHLDLEVYFSCEICPVALAFQKQKYAGRIVQIGDVGKWTDAHNLNALSRIDLILGGSPCNHLSLANPNRLGLDDPNSSGQLFFAFKKIRDVLQARMGASGHNFLWLYENTYNMPIVFRERIAKELGSSPVVLCSSSYQPALRKRLFFGNIPGMSNLQMANTQRRSPHTLQDVIGPNRQTNSALARTITTNTAHQVLVTSAGEPSSMFINDLECLMGFPKSHTDCAGLSVRQRTQMLAKGWSVDVVSDILRPLTEMYACKETETNFLM